LSSETSNYPTIPVDAIGIEATNAEQKASDLSFEEKSSPVVNAEFCAPPSLSARRDSDKCGTHFIILSPPSFYLFFLFVYFIALHAYYDALLVVIVCVALCSRVSRGFDWLSLPKG
jgi:hypothetical protein